MPTKPQNYIPPAIPGNNVRIWDYIDTRDYVDISIPMLQDQNNPIDYIKTQLIQILHPTTPASVYGYEWDPNVNMNNKSNLRLYADGMEIVDHLGSAYRYAPWMNDPYQQFQWNNGGVFGMLYFSSAIQKLTVSGFKDIATGPLAGQYSQANGTYYISANGYAIGSYYSNNVSYRINPSTKKYWWGFETGANYYHSIEFVRNGITNSGKYILKRMDLIQGSNQADVKVLATSESVHLYGYNEDILKPTLIKWIPTNLSMGTGGYIEVNSFSNPVVPQVKPKKVRFGGNFKLNGTKVKFAI